MYGDLWEQFDFTGVQDSIDQIFLKNKIEFSKFVEMLISGEKLNSDYIFEIIRDAFWGEMEVHKKALLTIVAITVFAGIFRAVADVFDNHQIADMSYYSMFLLLFTILVKTFSKTAQIGAEVVLNLADFMRALIPAYSLGIGLASGEAGAAAFSSIALFFIFLATEFIRGFLFPLIHIYVILALVNHMAGGEYLKQAAELLKSLIQFLSKTMIGIAVGVNFIQGMISPVIDSARRGLVVKAFSVLPGIGKAADSVVEVAVSAAILIKNGIGIAGALILVLIAAAPILKIMACYVMYKLTAAILGPIAHKNIAAGISEVGEAALMLLKSVMTALLLFLITIAIIMVSTGH